MSTGIEHIRVNVNVFVFLEVLALHSYTGKQETSRSRCSVQM